MQISSLRVTICTPPLQKSGGVGTLYSYAQDAFGDNVKVCFLDTRGNYSNPIFSIISLGRAVIILTIQKLNKKVDLVHLNLGVDGSAIRKFLLMFVCRMILHIPYVVQIHSGQFYDFYQKRSVPTQKFMKSNLNASRRILVLGESWKQKFAHLGFSLNLLESFIMGVPDLLDGSLKRKEPESRNDNQTIVLFAGKLGDHKGLRELLLSLKATELQNTKLIVCGPGDIGFWANLSQQSSLSSQVTFLGALPSPLLYEQLSFADILVLPSRSEGLPVIVMEALSAQKLVVTTPVGSLPEFLIDGEHCVYISSVTVEAVRQSLVRAIKLLDTGQSIEIATNGRKVWESHFNCTLTTNRLISIWAKSLQQPTPPNS